MTTQSSDSTNDLKSSHCLQHLNEFDSSNLQLLDTAHCKENIVPVKARKGCLKGDKMEAVITSEDAAIQSISKEVPDLKVVMSAAGSVGFILILFSK